MPISKTVRKMTFILNSVGGKIVIYILLEDISRHVKDKVTGNSQQGLSKTITPDQLDYFLWRNVWLCGWGESSEHHLDFSKTFSSVSDSILVVELRRDWLYGWKTREMLGQREQWPVITSPAGVWLWMPSFKDWYGTVYLHILFTFNSLISVFWYLHQWPAQLYRETSRSKFNKGKRQILYLAWNNSMYQDRLGPTKSKANLQKQRGYPGGCQFEHESAVPSCSDENCLHSELC